MRYSPVCPLLSNTPYPSLSQYPLKLSGSSDDQVGHRCTEMAMGDCDARSLDICSAGKVKLAQVTTSIIWIFSKYINDLRNVKRTILLIDFYPSKKDSVNVK